MQIPLSDGAIYPVLWGGCYLLSSSRILTLVYIRQGWKPWRPRATLDDAGNGAEYMGVVVAAKSAARFVSSYSATLICPTIDLATSISRKDFVSGDVYICLVDSVREKVLTHLNI